MEFIKRYFKTYQGLPKEIYIIAIARFINAVGLFIFPLLTLILTKKIGISESETGFWIAISGFSSIPMSIIGGKLTDYIGRKKLIIIPNIIAAILFGICGFLEPEMLMVYLIIIAGSILHSTRPAMNSLIGDLTTPENRNESFSLSYFGNNLGFAFGPFIGGLLFENHLRLFFLIDALTTVLATILMAYTIKETLEKAKENTTRSMEKSVKGSAFSVLLNRPIIIIFSILLLGYHFIYAQWSFLMPIHLESLFVDRGANLFGKFASFNGLIVVIFTPIITNVFSKMKDLRKSVIAGILYTIGFGLLGFIQFKLAFLLSVFIFTLGEILLVIAVMPFISNHTPVSHRGRINSIVNIILGAGHMIGPIITGRLLDYITIQTTWKVIGIIGTISTLGILVLDIFYKDKTIAQGKKVINK
ncbi:MAG: MFS transporter [Bacillota bacterium]